MSCAFCDNAFTNEELTMHNDSSYFSPKDLLCTNGVSLHIRSGDGRKLQENEILTKLA